MATSPNYGWLEPDNTDLVKNGALAIRTLGNAIDTTMATMTPKSLVDAKGDLIAATANDTPARLAVGNNGETLVADSSATTGLRYTAGTVQSNPVLNSAFQIWQRGTSVAVTSGTFPYTADRWNYYPNGANNAQTVSRQATGDTTNLPNIQYCGRFQRNSGQTGTGAVYLCNSFETINSIPYVGKQVTFSFYARAGANYSSSGNGLYYRLYSGTGTDQLSNTGYTGATAVIGANATLTTTWQRFTGTGTVGTSATELSIEFSHTPSGTAGANDYYEITGVQIDIGAVALPFRTNGGTIAGELAACQRYYYRQTADATATYAHLGYARGDSATVSIGDTPLPVTMRVTPTSIDFANIAVTDGAAVYAATAAALTGNQNNAKFAAYQLTHASGVTQFRFYYVVSNNNSAGYLGFSAEL